ncbi:MAG: OmpA family protein [Bacteroidetes bacterium]|nr:OmpA family protein [Bacteroidota bacterium]HET6246046.1 OmpA family protein [Bacteroidia bacterium]
MKFKFFLSLLLLLFINICLINGQSEPTFSGEITGKTIDAKGNLYTTGYFSGIVRFGHLTLRSTGGEDIFIAKYDPSGRALWVSKAGGDGNDASRAICLDKDGNTYITGEISGKTNFGRFVVTSGGSVGAFVAKFNPSGDLLWIQVSKNKGSSWGSALQVDGEKNVYATGAFENEIAFENSPLNSNGNLDGYFLKISPSGKVVWANKLGNKGEDRAYSISYNNGNIFIAGQEENNGVINAYLSKYSSSAALQWSLKAESTSPSLGKLVVSDVNGNSFFIGSFYGELKIGNNTLKNSGASDIFLSKINSQGKVEWVKHLAGAGYEIALSSAIDKDANIYITGSYTDSISINGNSIYSNGGEDAFYTKISPEGKCLWLKNIGNRKNDVGTSILTDNFLNCYLAGRYTLSAHFDKQTLTAKAGNAVYMAKLNSKGSFEWVINAFEPDPNFDFNANADYVDLYAKLMYGKDSKNSLINQIVKLEDNKGEVLMVTQTDDYGDFSFKNVNAKEKFNIVLEKNVNLPSDAPLFIATQTGVLLKELSRDKNNNFSYEILPAEVKILTIIPEDNAEIKIKNFKKSSENEVSFTENILYESGQSELDMEAKKMLNKLFATLKQNPTYKLEIYSHTDSRGDNESNLKLSEKRAGQVKDYLVKKGLETQRIISKGFGESQLLNRCKDDVDCSELEHQYNRRTEFKIKKV